MDNITNLTSKDYSSYISQSQTNNLTNQIKNSSSAEATDEEMLSACKEFEAYFTEQVFKAMEKMVPESDESSSSTSYVNMFKDTLIQEYASLSSESNGGEGLGIAQMLYEQMKRNYSND